MNTEDPNGKVLLVSGVFVSLFSFLYQSNTICFKHTLTRAGMVILKAPAGNQTTPSTTTNS